MAAVFLLVGLPASGKTARARELALENHALRFTLDEWVIPLFGADDGMAGGSRDVLGGRVVSMALELVCIDTKVVLDFGCWAREERSALRSVCTDLDRWRTQFQPPDDAEMGGASPDEPPAPFSTWLAWAQDRWPSLAVPSKELTC